MLLLKSCLVSTHYMVADMLTKCLEKSSFIRFRNDAMNSTVTVRDSLERAALSLHGEARRLVNRLLAQL